MHSKSYERPTKSTATAIGESERRRWSRQLRSEASDLIPFMEFLAAEENVIAAARQRRMQSTNHTRWHGKPSWTSTRIRCEQMAVLNVLQERHLSNTGKEISKAEVLAALMTAGLEAILNRADFGQTA